MVGAVVGAAVSLLLLRQRAGSRSDEVVLAQILEDHPSVRGLVGGRPPPNRVRAISGKKHREVLRRAIDGASDSLCILSGWISMSVIDPLLLQRVESALQRGVDVFIGFGYETKGKHCQRRAKMAHFRRAKMAHFVEG
jgi:hypothetical protein